MGTSLLEVPVIIGLDAGPRGFAWASMGRFMGIAKGTGDKKGDNHATTR